MIEPNYLVTNAGPGVKRMTHAASGLSVDFYSSTKESYQKAKWRLDARLRDHNVKP